MKTVNEIVNLEPGGEIRVGDGAPGVNFAGVRIKKNTSGYEIATYKDDEVVVELDSEGFLANAEGSRMAFLSDVLSPQAISTVIRYLSLSRAVTTLARDLKEDVACISIPIVPIGVTLFETGDILVLVNHTDAETVQLTVSANQLAGDDHIHVNSWIPQQKFYRGSAIYQSDKELLSMIVQTESAISLKVSIGDVMSQFTVEAASITATTNIFKSNTWNGTVDGTGHITVHGTAGWAITGASHFEFNKDASNYVRYNGSNLEIGGTITIVGGSGWTNLSDKPTSLANINATEGSKLSGIAAGATVGATWGTNLGSIPTMLTAPSGDGLYLSSTYMGFYKSSAWKTYIDNAGNLVLGDIAGGNTGLSWSQGAATLTIKGSITMTGGSIAWASVTAPSYTQITGTKPNGTYLDGSGIYTGTLTASQVNATNLTVTGDITSGSMTLGSTNKIWLNNGSDGVLALGGSTKASAPFYVSAAGALTATSATITGVIKTGTVGARVEIGIAGLAYMQFFDNTIGYNSQICALTGDFYIAATNELKLSGTYLTFNGNGLCQWLGHGTVTPGASPEGSFYYRTDVPALLFYGNGGWRSILI